MVIYIHVLSYNKMFLYFYLCLCVQLDSLSCSFTSIWLLVNTIQCNTTTQTNRIHSMDYHTIKYFAMINKQKKNQLLKINAKLVWSRALSSRRLFSKNIFFLVWDSRGINNSIRWVSKSISFSVSERFVNVNFPLPIHVFIRRFEYFYIWSLLHLYILHCRSEWRSWRGYNKTNIQ